MTMEIVHESIDSNEKVDFDTEDISIDEDNGQLAVGLKIPTSIKTPGSYIDGLRKYKDIYNDIYQQMEVCSKLHRFNGIIGNAVDILVDFAVTNVRPEPTGSKKLDGILEYWFENLNDTNSNALPGIHTLMQEIGIEWFTSGNAFPYSKWDNRKIGNSTYKIPININLINPQSIRIPEGPIAFGQEVIFLKYGDDLITKLRADGRTDPEAALIKQAVPRSILNAIKKGSGFSDGVRLNPKYITHLKRKAKGYQAWGIPYLSRCFSAVSILERLRELDESITSGLLNLVTVFKIGTEEHPASPARLRKFAALLRNPKATTTLVWAHDVTIEQVGPDGKILAFKDKTRDAKEDVMISMGIPPVLMSLSQSGDEWVSILSLVEKLIHWRKTMSSYLEKEGNKIAVVNGFKQKVKVKWDRMNLTNDAEVKNLILSFYDRGLISIDTALKDSKYNYKHELQRKEEEESQKEKFAPPNLPFSGGRRETDKGRTIDNSPERTKKKMLKREDKSKNTVDLKEQKKSSKPKRTVRKA